MEFQRLLSRIEIVLSPGRFRHTMGVVDWAERLAERYGIHRGQVRIAALLHDCAKKMSNKELLERAVQAGIAVDRELKEQPSLLHGPVGAVIAREEYGIDDPQILQAISYHTLGSDNMTTLDKLIFLADMVEVNRRYPGVEELRVLTLEDLDRAMVAALDQTIRYLLDCRAIIHPQTISTRNNILRVALLPGTSP